MDRRFPERVVVTEKEFLGLKEAVEKLGKLPDFETRIKNLEGEIAKMNVAMGFVGPAAKSAMGAFQR